MLPPPPLFHSPPSLVSFPLSSFLYDHFQMFSFNSPLPPTLFFFLIRQSSNLALSFPPSQFPHVLPFHLPFICGLLVSLSPTLLLPSFDQASSFKGLWWYWGSWGLAMGTGPLSHPQLDYLLLLCLEGYQVDRKG